MSSLTRFLSASAAAWVRIVLTVLTQVLLVPVFLTHWSVEQYGCWLIIQTIVSLSSMLSTSHQNFVGYEFLKVGDKQPEKMRLLFYSAFPYAMLIALLELLVVAGLIYFGFIQTTFDPDRKLESGLLHQAFWSLIIYSAAWLVNSSVGGLASRAVAPYGYFPRMMWWSTILAVVTAVVSGIAVALGADLLETVIVITITTLVVSFPVNLDMWRMFRRHHLHPVRPDWRLGGRNVGRSLAIALSAVLDISRQQGVRIFLGAIIGVTEMTAFSTMRTMSNLSLQGIGTITNPIMPEIMKFLRERDSERTNATVGFVWFFAVILLSPLMIAFQWIMPFVFHAWTRGKIAFNPVLFGLFSIALLLFSLARPPVAVLQGNNLLRVQLLMSIAVSVVAVGGILIFTAPFGVVGAAASLLLAELLGTVIAVWSARQWLERSGIGFPWSLFTVALASIVLASVTIALMAYLPGATLPIFAASIVVNAVLAIAFTRRLPPLALQKMRGLLARGFGRRAPL
jgi:O-antigen/teichoic acid export membrane protein